MKKTLEIIYDGVNSQYGLDDENTAFLVVLKKPNAGTLRVLVTDVDEQSMGAILDEWGDFWDNLGMKLRQEILRRPGESIDIAVIDEVGNIE